MFERLTLVMVLTIAAISGFYLLRMIHMQRIGQMRRMSADAAVTGVPTLLYFRSDTCAVCPAQSRFIEQVANTWNGRLIIEQVDAEAEPEKAGRYQVFTLPTTIVIDAGGKVQQVNYGLVDDRKLARQLAELERTAVAASVE